MTQTEPVEFLFALLDQLRRDNPAPAMAPYSAVSGESGHRSIKRRRVTSKDSIVTDLLTLAGFLGACFAAATTGAVFKPGDWYRALSKPRWTPPDWLFPVAWTLLYLTIAVSGWLVLRTAGLPAALPALAVYGGQLVLNAAWSPLFFGLKRPDLGLVGVVFLWLSIVATITVFYPLHTGAALLLVPYALWASFAGALNFEIWRRNRGRTVTLSSRAT